MKPHHGGSRRAIGTLILGIIVLAFPARAQTPSTDGQWSKPFPLPLIAIHSAMLPTGKVLLFSAEHGVPGIHGWLLDPDGLQLTEIPPPDGWNPDCAGHSFLPDGRLLVAGGTLQFNPLLGDKRAYLFDPYTEAWSRIEDMRRGRWYPTNITLPDGRVVTMSGINDTTGEINPDIEVWDPNGVANWELLGQKVMPYYPYLHVLPDGLIFRSGPDPQTETFDPATAQWTPVDQTNFPGRYEAPSVLLPPTLTRVMVVGGFTGMGPPTSSAEIIDLGTASPQWVPTAHMQYPRLEHNAVLLPDGKVLVVGGRSNSGNPPNPVLIPELFNPVMESWRPLAPHQVPRRYHSTALLLPDGRVLVAGGDNYPSGEIYSPPYLFQGPRPEITEAPAAIAYGSTFSIDFSSSTLTNTVALICMSSVTHSVNMGQRYVRLAELASGGGTAAVPAPASPNLAPPGFYMLFVSDENDVPSLSQVVRVITRFGDLDQDDDVDAVDAGAFEDCFTGPNGGPLGPTCEPGDFDADDDIDCDDWSQFLLAWTEPGDPPSFPPCGSTGVPDHSAPGQLLTLRQAVPNPFTESTVIYYFLSAPSGVRLSVHDVSGRRVAQLVDELKSAGNHAITWNGVTSTGTRAAPGVYFALLKNGNEEFRRTIVLMR